MSTIQERAAEALSHFEQIKRGDDTIWTRRDNAPQWVEDMTYQAHGDMLPDDWRYEFIVSALDAIAEDGEDAEVEADIYNGEPYRWLASNLNRASYVDETVAEYGHGQYLSDDISAGQYTERQEVLQLVLSFLSDMEDDEEGED